MTAKEQEQIFQGWLNDYRNVLFKVIRAYSDNPDDREDLFQEISIQLWHSVPKFEGKCAVTTWMYRIALNVSISWIKKEKRHNTEPLQGIHHVLDEMEVDEDPRLVWLYDQIRQFDEIDRSLSLLFLDGYSYKEMAEILGISESNAGVKIHRIKKTLTQRAERFSHYEY